jgi:hypothetical protein
MLRNEAASVTVQSVTFWFSGLLMIALMDIDIQIPTLYFGIGATCKCLISWTLHIVPNWPLQICDIRMGF